MKTLSSPMMDKTLNKTYRLERSYNELPLTKGDIVSKSLLALSVTMFSILLNIYLGFTAPAIMSILSMVGGLGAIGLGFFLFFSKKDTSTPFWTFLLAALQGLIVGGFTYYIGTEKLQDGTPGWSLVGQAVFGSTVVFFIAFMLYAMNIVRPSEKFRSAFTVVLVGMSAMYAINFIVAITLGHNFLLAEGPIPILIAIVAIVMASIRVITDIQDCDTALKMNYPSRAGWLLAASIVSSLIWLYVEILRLLYLLKRS